MAYVAPNTFSNGTKINGSDVDQNIDVLQSYVNGGVSNGDIIGASTTLFDFKHVMKGEYFPTNNSYEFPTGQNQGTLGINNPGGYAANILGNSAVTGTGIDFYLEEDADVFIMVTCYPRPYSGLDLAEVGLNSRTTTFSIRKVGDAASKATTTTALMTESEFGVGNGASNDGGIYGAERRRPFYAIFEQFLTAGNHSYRITSSAGERSVPIFFYQVNVYSYYRDVTT